jgi:hypothetical protein
MLGGVAGNTVIYMPDRRDGLVLMGRLLMASHDAKLPTPARG